MHLEWVFRICFIFGFPAEKKAILISTITLMLEQAREFVMNQNPTWTPIDRVDEGNVTANFIKMVNCHREENNINLQSYPLRTYKNKIQAYDIPAAYDIRDLYNCTNLLFTRDQGGCGSCWACASATAISLRICHFSKGKKDVYISEDDILTCCIMHEGNRPCGRCNGGGVINAMAGWKLQGYCTGLEGGCKIRTIRTCDHYTASTDQYGTLDKCEHVARTPDCRRECTNTLYRKTYEEDKRYATTIYAIQGEHDIMVDILLNGPVAVGIRAFADFGLYQTGIYQIYLSSFPKAIHALVLVGWGIKNGLRYWIVQNSWNNYWGENGYMKFIRGRNEGGIENITVTGIPGPPDFNITYEDVTRQPYWGEINVTYGN